jgi:hypothetical protein
MVCGRQNIYWLRRRRTRQTEDDVKYRTGASAVRKAVSSRRGGGRDRVAVGAERSEVRQSSEMGRLCGMRLSLRRFQPPPPSSAHTAGPRAPSRGALERSAAVEAGGGDCNTPSSAKGLRSAIIRCRSRPICAFTVPIVCRGGVDFPLLSCAPDDSVVARKWSRPGYCRWRSTAVAEQADV